jgi:drug/metabolite transporter (DMT)-like permease
MSADLAGQLAALGAATCWAFSALAFETATRRIGVLAVNLFRLAIALVLLTLAAGWARGRPLPDDATPAMWGWLAASGLVGFTFGDLCLLRSYVLIGPRLATLTMSFVPLVTALLGWLALGETLNPREGAGMLLTMAGIAWAVFDRRRASDQQPEHPAHRHLVRGLLLGLGGAVGQGGGLVLSKLGMGSYPALAATQVRVIAGLAGYGVLFTVMHSWRRIGAGLRDAPGLQATAVGAFFGPFLGVSLSLVAVRLTVAGVAATLMSLTPILVLPMVFFARRERIGWGGLFGALLAVVGAALLFL